MTKKSSHQRPAEIQPSMRAAGPRGRWWLHLLPPALVFIVTCIVFWPAVNGQFLPWDDIPNIVQNEHVHGLAPVNLRWMFTAAHMGHYHPLTWLSFAIDYSINGLQPRGYHLTNIVIHALNAALVYGLMLMLLSAARGVGSKPDVMGRRNWAAAFAAMLASLLFAVHPMRVESVAWITERRDVLNGLFVLLCVICYLKYAAAGKHRHSWYLLCLAMFLLSLLSKAISLSLPLVLLAIDWYPLRRNLSWRTGRIAWLDKVPFLALAAASAVITLAIQRPYISSLETHPLPGRIAQAVNGLVYYPLASLFPLRLLPLYEIPRHVDPLEIRYLASAAAVVALVVLVFVMRRRWPALLTACIGYVVIVGPVLGLLQNGPQTVADRYSYLSMIGLTLAAAAMTVPLWRHRLIILRWLAAVTCIVIVSTLGVMSWRYSSVWNDAESLWAYTLRHDPHNGTALSSYAIALSQRGDVAGSIPFFERAWAGDPSSPYLPLNLAGAFMSLGQTGEAEKVLRKALEQHPESGELHRRLGDVLGSMARSNEAIAEYQRALAHGGTDVAAVHNNLANNYTAAGNAELAIDHARKALNLAPDRVHLHINLALRLYRMKNDRDSARQVLAAARMKFPENPELQAAMREIESRQPSPDG